MEDSLFPTDVPDFDTEGSEESEYDIEYKGSVAWDFEKGDFLRDGANRIVKCQGAEAYRTWCLKMVGTERYCCLAYPDELGVELDDIFDESDIKSVESDIERTITEALCVNPCTEYVQGFEFEWNGDSVYCSFIVKGIDTEEMLLTKNINGKETDIIGN